MVRDRAARATTRPEARGARSGTPPARISGTIPIVGSRQAFSKRVILPSQRPASPSAEETSSSPNGVSSIADPAGSSEGVDSQSGEAQLLRQADGSVRGPSGMLYVPTCMSPEQAPRRQAIKLVENPRFESTVLVVIVAACLVMAWESPLDPPGTWKAGMIASFEQLVLGVFTAEMVIKVCHCLVHCWVSRPLPIR